MNIAKFKQIISDAYAATENADVIPRFSTQFFFEKDLFIRIPIYECQPPPKSLVLLIGDVITTALPHLKKKPMDFEQDLLAAAEGKHISGHRLDIRGISMSTRASSGTAVNAVTECHVQAGHTLSQCKTTEHTNSSLIITGSEPKVTANPRLIDFGKMQSTPWENGCHTESREQFSKLEHHSLFDSGQYGHHSPSHPAQRWLAKLALKT